MIMPLVLVNNKIKPIDVYKEDISNDIAPRLDYIEIAQRLGSEITSDYGLFNTFWYNWLLMIEKNYLKVDMISPLLNKTKILKYNSYLSTSEKSAIPLSALLCLSNQEKPQIVIAHHLSSKRKEHFFRMWPLHKYFSHVICVCRYQAEYAIKHLEIPASKVDFIYDKVDHHYFRPQEVDTSDYILAVGREQRDYKTLLRSISGTGLKLIIVASSQWSSFPIKLDGEKNITLLNNISFQELRALYARARLVVTPLFDVDYAAGVNTLLEAMAMGKTSIVSRSSGICDYVLHNVTGKFVSPEDPEELRDTILTLWDQSIECKRLGYNARQAVEEFMNIDMYVDQVVKILISCLAIS